MNRRRLLQFAAAIPAMVPFVSAEDDARADAETADFCARLADFFQAGVINPTSHIGRLALSAAALKIEGHDDGFAAVVDRGVTMLQGGVP